MEPWTKPHYKREHLRILARHGKAPVCIWDDTHIQGGHGFEWANVSGVYSDDIEDYLPMCIPCHRKFDTSDKQRMLSSLRMKGKPAPNRVKIGKYSGDILLEVYESLTQAAKENKMGITSIAQNLSGKSLTSGGYKWRRM